MKVTIPTDPTFRIGFYFKILPEDEDTPERRHEAVEEFYRERNLTRPVRVNLRPCGGEYQAAEIPIFDIPCTCGNPKHWFVKWGEGI